MARLDELTRVRQVLDELEALQPWGDVTPASLAALRQHYRARSAALAGELMGVAVPAAGHGAAQPVAAGDASGTPMMADGTPADQASPVTGPIASPTAAPALRPSLQAFLADRSILLVSYAGAFLLVVATLLFEIYGASDFGGGARFGAVLALNLVFGLAGWWCRRRPRLRLVGTTYVAIFALTAPLVFLAGYVFVLRDSYAISPDVGLAVAGWACAALYGALSVRLGSRSYGALALAALLIGWIGAVRAAGLGTWSGVAVLPLIVLCLLLAQRLARQRPGWEVMAAPAAWTQHGAAVLATLWAVAAQPEAIDLRLSGSWGLPLTFAGLAAIYALDCRLTGRWQRLWIVALAATPAFLTAGDALDLPQVASALLLVALAWVYALAAGRVPGARATSGLRLVAGAQTLLAVPLASQDGLGAAVLLAATALGVFLARDTGAPGWLYLAGILGTLDWFWWARALLPEPPRATAAAFFAVYAPLPVVVAGAALLAGRMAGRRWARPLVAIAGLDAVWIVVGAMAVEDWRLLGTLLLVYGGIVYRVASLLRRPQGVAATLALAAGAVSLLYAAGAPAAAYPPVVAALAAAVYGAGRLWAWRSGREDAWTQAHAPAALALAGATALGCLMVPPFYRTGAGGALAAAAAWWAAALLLAVDGRRRGSARPTYSAGGIAVLGALWLVRYAGLTNPQAYAVPPGLWLVWAGAAIRADRRLRAPATAARLLAGGGAAVLLGTSAIQSFVGGPAGAVYTTVLVLEGIAALLAGIALRHRVLVVAGGTGLALGALRAVFPLLQTLPLFVVFGLAAVVLLAVAAGLAALRDRWRSTSGAASAWSSWT